MECGSAIERPALMGQECLDRRIPAPDEVPREQNPRARIFVEREMEEGHPRNEPLPLIWPLTGPIPVQPVEFGKLDVEFIPSNPKDVIGADMQDLEVRRKLNRSVESPQLVEHVPSDHFTI